MFKVVLLCEVFECLRIEVWSVVLTNNSWNAMFTEDLLHNVNYSPAGTVSLRNLYRKRELGIVVSDEYVFITVTVEEVACNRVPWARRNLCLDYRLFLLITFC